jgi:hypothetical protein
MLGVNHLALYAVWLCVSWVVSNESGHPFGRGSRHGLLDDCHCAFDIRLAKRNDSPRRHKRLLREAAFDDPSL